VLKAVILLDDVVAIDDAAERNLPIAGTVSTDTYQ
jgi:hypothetical protein